VSAGRFNGLIDSYPAPPGMIVTFGGFAVRGRQIAVAWELFTASAFAEHESPSRLVIRSARLPPNVSGRSRA